MKIFFWCLLIIMMACSCSPPKPELKGSLIHQAGKGYAIFLDLRDTTVYLVQVMDTVKVPAICSLESFSNDTLIVVDLRDSTSYRYYLDGNIYGIGSYRGNEYFRLLTDSEKKGFKFRRNIRDLISLMSCLCYPAGGNHICMEGGMNVNTCNSRLAHKVGKEIWFHNCQITCVQGYDACCN